MWRACLLLILISSVAGAAELRSIEVNRVDRHYVLTSEVWFDTDIQSIYAVFLNYDLTSRFSSFIVESRNLGPNDAGQPRFYIRNHGCVWFFCSSFERSGYVEHEPFVFIRSIADAEISDFHSSLESWRFQSDGGGTLVFYEFDFEPKFWIPPLVGSYMLRHKLQNDSARALDRIEAIAQGRQR
jgi:hypothetical protein